MFKSSGVGIRKSTKGGSTFRTVSVVFERKRTEKLVELVHENEGVLEKFWFVHVVLLESDHLFKNWRKKREKEHKRRLKGGLLEK